MLPKESQWDYTISISNPEINGRYGTTSNTEQNAVRNIVFRLFGDKYGRPLLGARAREAAILSST